MKAYITYLATYLPEIVEENEKGRLLKKTGIERRHICPEDMTAADMAVMAAEKLFSSGFAKENVDFMLYCTQSPDYPLPSTACILQDRFYEDLTNRSRDENDLYCQFLQNIHCR